LSSWKPSYGRQEFRPPICHPGQLRRDEELIQGLSDADLMPVRKFSFPYIIDSLNHYILESLKYGFRPFRRFQMRNIILWKRKLRNSIGG